MSKVGDAEHGEGSSRIEDQGSTRDTFVSREVRTPGAVIAANLSVAASLGEPQTPLERARTLVNPYAGRTSLSALVSVRKVVRWSFEIGRKYPTFENLTRLLPSRLLASGRVEGKSWTVHLASSFRLRAKGPTIPHESLCLWPLGSSAVG